MKINCNFNYRYQIMLPTVTHSLSKLFAPKSKRQAIDDGIIENENVSIANYFPELEGDKKSITIKHMLNHIAGLNWSGYLEHEKFLNSEEPARRISFQDTTGSIKTVV